MGIKLTDLYVGILHKFFLGMYEGNLNMVLDLDVFVVSGVFFLVKYTIGILCVVF